MTLQEFGDELLGMAIGCLKLSPADALSMDVNMLRLALHYHDEDLLKMNGIWPEQPKQGLTMKQVRQAFRGS